MCRDEHQKGMKRQIIRAAAALFYTCAALVLEAKQVELPGLKQDGSVLLPNAWSLRPAGRQTAVGDFPVNVAVHPGSRFAAVLHAGYGRHEVVVVDIRSERAVSRAPLPETFYGLCFSADGNQLFCSGAGDEVIHQFSFNEGALGPDHPITLRPAIKKGVPAGLAVDKAAREIFVANVWGHRISRVSLPGSTITDIPLTKEAMPDLNPAEAAPADMDVAAGSKRAQALLEETHADDAFPYACKLDEKGRRLYVSLWARAQVAVIDLRTNGVAALWPVGEHPNEMVLTGSGRLLYVANANRNTVTVLDTRTGRPSETIHTSIRPEFPPGSTPNSLALSPDEKTLFVANACNNSLAVFDVSLPGKSHSLGFIPTGWYPTSVRVTPDGKYLIVANGKGVMPKANPHGPQPGVRAKDEAIDYIGGLLPGTLGIIKLPSASDWPAEMERFTAQVYAGSPSGSNSATAVSPPFPLGSNCPVKYCLYIIKENRTYDQVLGDMKEGNGDPSLCLFDQNVTPNHHRLAREFVLLDNFYVDGEVSADGHEWTTSAYATDFVEKFWPLNYGHNKSGKYPYPSEGNFAVAASSGGYIWDRAAAAGVTYRSFGEFINKPASTNSPATTRVKSLQGHFDPWYRTFDLDYPDAARVDRYISELHRYESEGEMPRLQIIRLPNDHTVGTVAGKPTPRAYLADNDLAFGRLVDAVSHSKFWSKTAIFVVEDDAQNGPDHVDAHRTIAYAISPYVKRRAVDSTMYSTSGMLRTMELILGLKPMTQFDAAATPMFASFQATPDSSPYEHLDATWNMREKNTKFAWGSDKAGKLNFTREDAVDDRLLNEMVWRSVRGRDNPAPPPVRAAFVFVHPGGDND